MPKYNVDKTFWRKGLKVQAGEVISLSKAEAKYLGHVVTENKPVAPAAVAQETAPAAAPEEGREAGVSVTEAPTVSKRKRAVGDDSADASN